MEMVTYGLYERLKIQFELNKQLSLLVKQETNKCCLETVTFFHHCFQLWIWEGERLFCWVLL